MNIIFTARPIRLDLGAGYSVEIFSVISRTDGETLTDDVATYAYLFDGFLLLSIVVAPKATIDDVRVAAQNVLSRSGRLLKEIEES